MFIFDEDETYDPKNDGIDHINIYSRGKTKLGRMLSNFSYSPFSTDEFGHFECLEGFYFWYFTGKKHDEFRHLIGNEAKKHAKKYRHEMTRCVQLSEVQLTDFYKVCLAKVIQNEDILNELKKSSLPFVHYYVYCGSKVELDGIDWLSDIYMTIRSIL